MSRAGNLQSAALDDRSAPRPAERGSERATERRLERPAHRRLTDDGRYSIDLNKVPKGYVMEWKRHSVMAANDRHNQVVVRQYHWQPVPHKMQPHLLGHLCNDENEHIVVGGLGLYMRPAYLNDDAHAEQAGDTDAVLKEQLQALRLQSKDQVGARNTFIKKSSVAVPQPIDE